MRYALYFVLTLSASATNAVELIAHRANACGAIENTAAAISSSWVIRADAVELDVRVSRDNVAYLFHDAKIGDKVVANLSYEQVLGYVATYPVPTLSQALALHSSGGRYILDLKDVSMGRAVAIVDAVRASKTPHSHLTFQSDNLSLLAVFRSALPTSRLLFLDRLEREWPLFRPPTPQAVTERLSVHDIDGVSIKGRRFIDRDYIEAIKREGFLVYVWTINSPSRASHYKSIGVDGIVTDEVTTIAARLGLKWIQECSSSFPVPPNHRMGATPQGYVFRSPPR